MHAALNGFGLAYLMERHVQPYVSDGRPVALWAHDHHALFQLCEGLVDYDQLLQTWRYRHLMLVYRIIGTGTPSLKGKHSELLAKGMAQRFFPALWDVRDEVFGEWTAAQAAKGHDPGYHG